MRGVEQKIKASAVPINALVASPLAKKNLVILDVLLIVSVLLNSGRDKGVKPVWVLWKARLGITLSLFSPA
jgi:hypothetical protein